MGGVKCLEYHLPFTEILIDPDNFAWFIWALFFINVITITIDRLFGSKKVFLPILLMVVILIMSCIVMLDTNLMGLKQIGLNLQYFIVGYLMRRYDLPQYMDRKLALLTIPIFFVLVVFWERENMIILSVQLGIMANVYRMITAYMACLGFWAIFKVFFDKALWLSLLGTASLGIYLLHFYILQWILLFGGPLLVSFALTTVLSYGAVLLIRMSNYLKPFIGERVYMQND